MKVKTLQEEFGGDSIAAFGEETRRIHQAIYEAGFRPAYSLTKKKVILVPKHCRLPGDVRSYKAYFLARNGITGVR